MFEKILKAVNNADSFSWNLGSSAVYFTAEFHLTKEAIELLKTESPSDFREKDNGYTIMNCPVIEDSSNYLSLVHKINIVE